MENHVKRKNSSVFGSAGTSRDRHRYASWKQHDGNYHGIHDHGVEEFRILYGSESRHADVHTGQLLRGGKGGRRRNVSETPLYHAASDETGHYHGCVFKRGQFASEL